MLNRNRRIQGIVGLRVSKVRYNRNFYSVPLQMISMRFHLEVLVGTCSRTLDRTHPGKRFESLVVTSETILCLLGNQREGSPADGFTGVLSSHLAGCSLDADAWRSDLPRSPLPFSEFASDPPSSRTATQHNECCRCGVDPTSDAAQAAQRRWATAANPYR